MYLVSRLITRIESPHAQTPQVAQTVHELVGGEVEHRSTDEHDLSDKDKLSRRLMALNLLKLEGWTPTLEFWEVGCPSTARWGCAITFVTGHTCWQPESPCTGMLFSAFKKGWVRLQVVLVGEQEDSAKVLACPAATAFQWYEALAGLEAGSQWLVTRWRAHMNHHPSSPRVPQTVCVPLTSYASQPRMNCRT